MNINDLLLKTVKKYPYNTALIVSKNNLYLTYNEIYSKIQQLSSFFIARGISKNTNVAVKLKKSEKWVIVFFSLLNIGANPILIDQQFTERETIECLEISKTSILVTDKIMLNLDKINKQFIFDDNATTDNENGIIYINENCFSNTIMFKKNKGYSKIILFTYRGYGYPLAVVYNERSLIKSVFSNIYTTGVNSEVIISDIIPSSHIFSLTTSLLSILFVGGTVVVINNVMPGEILRVLEKYSVNLIIAVPSLIKILLSVYKKKHYDLTKCRRGMIGGNKFASDLFDEWHDITKGGILIQGYGLTESCPALCNHWDNYITESIGMPMYGTSVKIINNGKRVKFNERGIIFIKKSGMMDGFLNNTPETKNIFKNDWLDTGDVGWKDRSGFYYFHKRNKYIAKIGGATVDMNEIKKVIISYGNIHSIELTIEDDPVWQEKIICKITSNNEIKKEDLYDFLRKNLSITKIPKEINIINNSF